MGKPFSIRLAPEVEKELSLLIDSQDSMVKGKPRNFVIGWAIMTAALHLKMLDAHRETLPERKMQQLKAEFKEWYFEK